MSTRAAGQVKNGGGTLEIPADAENALDEGDMPLGLVVVSMGIELQILFAEPLFVPGHARDDSRHTGGSGWRAILPIS